MMRIQQESMQDCVDEVMELVRTNHQEVTVFEHIKFNPDVALFNALDTAGALFVLTLRNDGVLVGYSVNVLDKNPMSQEPRSTTLIMYIVKELRGSASLRLISRTEELSEELGALSHTMAVPAKNNYSTILLRRGYVLVETLYTKLL